VNLKKNKIIMWEAGEKEDMPKLEQKKCAHVGKKKTRTKRTREDMLVCGKPGHLMANCRNT